MATALTFSGVHSATQADVTVPTLAGVALAMVGEGAQPHQNMRNLIKIFLLHTV